MEFFIQRKINDRLLASAEFYEDQIWEYLSQLRQIPIIKASNMNSKLHRLQGICKRSAASRHEKRRPGINTNIRRQWASLQSPLRRLCIIQHILAADDDHFGIFERAVSSSGVYVVIFGRDPLNRKGITRAIHVDALARSPDTYLKCIDRIACRKNGLTCSRS